jgi:hypothetical protein
VSRRYGLILAAALALATGGCSTVTEDDPPDDDGEFFRSLVEFLRHEPGYGKVPPGAPGDPR